tara:strand:+ start:51 stop:596 length:546 start_codon:yes stop_codon:yes gene_type:complete
MDIVNTEEHRYANTYPCRLPVWWARIGEPGPHIDEEGITGMKIVLRIEKKFSRFETILARFLRAPKEIRRPLDNMNSMLWELCDGSRDFQAICIAMDACFHEDIAPVVDRTAAGIDALKSRNLMSILSQPFTKKWNIGPGLAPQHQRLSEPNKDNDYDTEPRSKNERAVIDIEEGSQQADQ